MERQREQEKDRLAAVTTVIIEPLLSIKATAEIEDTSPSVVYERIKAGIYQAVKDGARTKILAESIKRRRENLPRAIFPNGKSPRVAIA